MKRVPLLDLRPQHAQIRDQVLAEVVRVIDSQKFIMGEDVAKLEQDIAAYSSTQFAIGCASGSDALMLALMAAGVKARDKVLTTPYTFFATAGSIARHGSVPIFVDIDPVTFNLDVHAAGGILEKHPDIRAVIPVHLFGGCADMDPLLEATRSRGIAIIEDAAQAIGAEYKGRRAGSIGLIGCFSFFPSKNLGGYGDAGMLTTNHSALAEQLKVLRVHGARSKYYHDQVGVNSRLDTLQAAVLRVKLRYLDSWTTRRQANAALYREILGTAGVPVILPASAPYQSRHIYNQFVIRCDRRDALRTYLNDHGVGTEIYYPLPLHLQTCFADLGYKPGDFPVSERVAAESLALPIHSDLARADIEYVCGLICSFFRE